MTAEDVRGAVHTLAGLLAFAIGMHNVVRFVETRRPKNAVIAAVNLGYCALELANAKEHVVPPSPYGPTHMGVGA